MSAQSTTLPAALLSDLARDAVNESWRDVEKLVYRITHKFARVYHMQFADLLPEAMHAFVRAYKHYKTNHEKKASFSSFVGFVVTKDLTTFMRNRDIRRAREQKVSLDEANMVPTYDSATFLTEFREDLTADANFVVTLVVEMPEELMTYVKWNRKRKSDNNFTAHNILSSIREHLLDIGWDKLRVEETFEEVRNALA